MRALVTGTEGFIGRNLKTELEKQGWEVVTFEERDLKDNWKLDLNEIFALKLDACFHVGACSDTLEQDVNYMMLLNYEVTKYLTDLCKQNQVKLVLYKLHQVPDWPLSLWDLNYFLFLLFFL